jgi:hypothetical protein
MSCFADIWKRGGVHTGFWWRRLNDKALLRPRFIPEDDIKLYKSVGRAWTGLTWLRIGTSGWLLVNAVMDIRGP